MTIEETKLLFTEKFPDREIVNVRETSSYFLISSNKKRGHSSELNKNITISLVCDDGLYAVDKKTKKIFTYNPIRDGE